MSGNGILPSGTEDTRPANGAHNGRMPRWYTRDATHASFAVAQVGSHSDIYVPPATAALAGALSAADKTILVTLNQPHYQRYWQNVAQAAIVSGTQTRIAYDTLDTGTNAPFVNTAGLFTLQTGYDGVWEVCAFVRWATSATVANHGTYVRKNGATIDIGELHNGAIADSIVVPCYAKVALVAGDTIDVVGVQFTGASKAPLAGTKYGTRIYLNWVGRP